MAAKKKKAPKAKSQATSTPSIAASVITSLPLLTTAERAELMQQYSDQQCETWGGRTRASDTLKDAYKWLATMKDVVLELAPPEYHATRLAFVAEVVLALEVADSAPVPGASTEGERLARDASLLGAQAARGRLLRALYRTAGGREAVRARIAASAGDDRFAPGALDSLGKLIAVARAELTASPTASRASGLTAAMVNEAEFARAALEVANRAAATGTIAGTDSVQTNRLEGRVLRELRLAWNSLRDARTRDGRVPALVPGPALVRAFKLIEKEEPEPTPS